MQSDKYIFHKTNLQGQLGMLLNNQAYCITPDYDKLI